MRFTNQKNGRSSVLGEPAAERRARVGGAVVDAARGTRVERPPRAAPRRPASAIPVWRFGLIVGEAVEAEVRSRVSSVSHRFVLIAPVR